MEFIRQPLYDSELITSSVTEVRFFVNPKGASSKTAWHTNLTTASLLAVPKTHLIDGFRFVPYGMTADASQLGFMRELLYDQTYVRFTLGDLKDYLLVPTWYMPAGVGIPGFSDTGGLTSAAQVAQVSNGAPIHGNYLSIRSHPILLPSQQTFTFTFATDAVLTGITTDIRCWVVFEGVNGRETM